MHQRIGKLGVVDMTGNAIKPSVAYPTKRLLDGLEQRRIGDGIMKRLARRVQRRGPFFRDEEADRAVATIELLGIQKPIWRLSAAVVRINVTCGLWRWSLRPAYCAGTVLIAQKLTMSRGPTEPT